MSQSLAQTVMVAKMRKTALLLPLDQIEHVFDVVNAPGISIICVSELGDEGELVEVSRVYEVDRLQYGSADEALLAWDESLVGVSP